MRYASRLKKKSRQPFGTNLKIEGFRSGTNYVKKSLEVIGLGDKIDISAKDDFKDFRECCVFGVAQSKDGSFSVSLSVDAGPFTIVGVPIPPKFKKWVAADLLNITLFGVGSVELSGNYKACDNNTTWSGGGDLTAELKLGGELTIHTPKDIIVILQNISGSTSITETLSTDLTNLKLTTNWGGLTGTVAATIKIIWFKTPLSFSKSRTYFKKSDIAPPITIPLPSLK